MDPRQMAKMLKQFGVNTEELKAKKVTMELGGKTVVFNNAQVFKMNVQGQTMYQVIPGTEAGNGEEKGVPEEDVKLVSEQSGAGEERARKALEEFNGDIAKAIDSLSKK
ncbi:MAG TPA: nascent polypeptide-associated complex protein [archaeon]|nr:nascent polypeptide-associated complex protein [archaeon]